MPPRAKVTREMVLDAAFEIVRSRGIEELNVRTVAERLNCSTQPVLYSFRTVDEIKEAVYGKADEYHTAYIMPDETDEDPMLALGLKYIRFGHEEKNLFRFLFQTNQFGGMDIVTLMHSPNLGGIIGILSSELKCDEEEAVNMFLTLFTAAHGLASLLANNAMPYDEARSRKMLEEVFYGMMAFRKGERE